MKRALGWIVCYGMWIALSILAGVAAWYAHTAVLYLAALLVEHPTLRPPGWSSSTLAGMSKLSILVVGSLWLIFMMWMEGALRSSVLDANFWSLSVRLLLGIGAAWLIFYAVLTL